MKYIALLLIITFLGFAVALPAEASSYCRTLNDRAICILSIQRSAKNYWEYRAVVSIDGVKKPLEVYNCRDRVRIRSDGTAIAFRSGDIGDLICSVLNR